MCVHSWLSHVSYNENSSFVMRTDDYKNILHKFLCSKSNGDLVQFVAKG